MKAYVITLKDNEYSERKATRCIETAREVGKIEVTKFYGVDKFHAQAVMKEHQLKWTWANNNKSPAVCPLTGLYQRPYYNANLDAKIGCAMSHYILWTQAMNSSEPTLILEHDAVFIREFPMNVEFKGILQINDPNGGGRNGRRLSETMVKRGTYGVQRKTKNQSNLKIPDGLAGNSAYLVKPEAAKELVGKYKELGVWPNDATMCIQLFPYLEEYFPFITKIEQEISTSSI